MAGHRIKFAEASALADHPYSCIHIETDRYLDIRVPMSQLSSVDSAIKESVIELMNHYIESLDGVLIAYSKLRLVSPDVDLSEVLGVFQDVRIYGTFAIFRPRPGRLLEGVIFRVNPSHIGCMVHKNFTTSLKAEKGVANLNGLYAQGQQIVFKVTKMERKNNLCYIKGVITKDLVDCRKTGQPVSTSVPTFDSTTSRTSLDKAALREALPVSSDISLVKMSPESGFASEPCSSAVPSSSEALTESDAASSDVFVPRKKHKKRKRNDDSVAETLTEAPELVMDLDVTFPEPGLPDKKKKKKDSSNQSDINIPSGLALNGDSVLVTQPGSGVSHDSDPETVRRPKKKRRKVEEL